MSHKNAISAYNLSFQSIAAQERSSLTMEVVHSRIQWYNVESSHPLAACIVAEDAQCQPMGKKTHTEISTLGKVLLGHA